MKKTEAKEKENIFKCYKNHKGFVLPKPQLSQAYEGTKYRIWSVVEMRMTESKKEREGKGRQRRALFRMCAV